MFPGRFDKQDEKDQLLAEIELYIIFKFNRILTESDIDNNGIWSQLQQQIQNQVTNVNGWKIDIITSTILFFFRRKWFTFYKIMFRYSTTLNVENDDKNCFISSILASVHFCKKKSS